MRLLSMTTDQIEKFTNDMVKQITEIKKNAYVLSWYSRGGVSYTDTLNMSNEELQIMNEVTDSNLETTKKSRLPFF